MQLAKTFNLINLAALAAAAENFSLLVIESGSDVQYNNVVSDNGALYLKSGNSASTYTLKDDHSLYDPSTKKYISVKDNGFVESDTPDKNFGNSGGYLTYKSSGFYYDSNKKLVLSKGNGVALRLEKPTKVQSSTTLASSTKTPSTARPTSANVPDSSKNKVQFGVIAIRSGSKFQNGPIKKVDSHPHVFSVGGSEGKDVVFTLSSDGTMVDQDGRGIYYDSKTGELGEVDPYGAQKASNGFSIKDGELHHEGKGNWKACPSGNDQYSLADNNCTGGTSITLKVIKN